MKWPWTREKEKHNADILFYAPRYCSEDGSELVLRVEKAYDPSSGEEFVRYRFLECGFDKDHCRYQFMRGNKFVNSIWLPLDEW